MNLVDVLRVSFRCIFRVLESLCKVCKQSIYLRVEDYSRTDFQYHGNAEAAVSCCWKSGPAVKKLSNTAEDVNLYEYESSTGVACVRVLLISLGVI